MRPQAAGAVLDPTGGIPEIPAAPIPQRIKGAVAEQAVEGFGICPGMTGEVFTFPILIKFAAHLTILLKRRPGIPGGGFCRKFHRLTGIGVPEAKGMRPQGDLAGILQGAVFSISHQGQTPAGKLGPDLMGAAGDQPDTHLGQVIGAGEHPVFQSGFLHILARLGHHIGFAFFFASQKQILQNE